MDLADAARTNLDLTFTAQREHGEQGLTVELGDGSGNDIAYAVGLGPWKDELSGVTRIRHGIGEDRSDAQLWRGFASDVPARVRVRNSEGRIQVWVDDEQVHDLTPSLAPRRSWSRGHVTPDGAGAGDAASDPEHVLRLVNATPEVRSVRVILEERTVTRGHGEVLTGSQPQKGVPFETSPVQPVAVRLEAADRALAVDLEPWSRTSAVVQSTAD